MTTTEPIVNSLLNRLADAKAKLRAIDSEREELLRSISSLEYVVQMYTGRLSADRGSDSNSLASLTLGEALVQIAEENNGALVVVEAKRLLLESGKLTSPKNASPRLYGHLAGDSHFQKVSPGKYRLVKPSGRQVDVPAFPEVVLDEVPVIAKGLLGDA